MKRKRNLFLCLLIVFSLLLNGCSFLLEPDDGDVGEVLEDFEFVTDGKMTVEDSDYGDYYRVTLHGGEGYQIKTDVDDKLGEDYYLIYSTDDDIEGKFTLSDDGYIQVAENVEENEVFSIDVDLYNEGSYRRVAHKYFFLSLLSGDYAEITLGGDGIEYDEESDSYSLTLESGSALLLSTEVRYNTAYTLSFALADVSSSAFMNVNSDGLITTVEVDEDKSGEIIIETIGRDGVLDTLRLTVNLKKSTAPLDELRVTDVHTGDRLSDGDRLTVYCGKELAFSVKYGGEAVSEVITVDAPDVLSVDTEANAVRAISVGECSVTFTYNSKTLTVTVTVLEDELISLSANGGGRDFVIINNNLHFLGGMYAEYTSGERKQITDTSLITYVLADLDASFKTVSFTYTDGKGEASVEYDVEYYLTEEYVGHSTAYDSNDFLSNYYTGSVSALPKAGTVKILVIPVWFCDSSLFFKEEHKTEILEDIEYTMMGDRPEGEFLSAKQYYEAQSYGAIDMDITVSEFYSSDTSYTDYSDNIEEKSKNTAFLANDAIDWYFSEHREESFEDYDLNGDGYLDGLVLYYGSNYYGQESDGNSSTAYAKTNNDNKNYHFNTLSFCPIGGLYGLKRVDLAPQLAASDLSEEYKSAFRTSSKTVIHEMGHMFGNDDLYEDALAAERFSPAGGFVMQDNNYGSHDPYHVNRIGWSLPEIYASSDYSLGDRITVHMGDFQSTGQNIILTNRWNSANSLYDEYIIIELFAPEGLNRYDSEISFFGMLEGGIRVWHIYSYLTELHGDEKTYEIIDGRQYSLSASNNDVEYEHDLVHLIRNNPDETFNTTSMIHNGKTLFGVGDTFDMSTFSSQFQNGDLLDNGEKLGWAFTVDCIYREVDGKYGAVLTLERTDNERTEFSTEAELNRSDLSTPEGIEDYTGEIFGEDGDFTFTYKYNTPPSAYEQGYPISDKGMCLFASADGDGGYIEISAKDIDERTVTIKSISITYSKLTNAALTVLSGEDVVTGERFTPEDSSLYGYTYEVGASTVRIQNQYSEAINHWSVIALYSISIEYSIS